MGPSSGTPPVGKVGLGFFSFTEVTDPSAHQAYNQWHQLDHLPEQMPLPGVDWGQRWVSTPACRRARAVTGGDLDGVHYVTLYLMSGTLLETLDAFAALAEQLRHAGRYFEHRRAHLSGPFVPTGAEVAPRVLVSPAAVPFRPGRGIYVVVEQPEHDADDAAVHQVRDPGVALAVEQVAGVWSFASSPGLARGRWRPGAHRVTVCFLDGDPLSAAGALGPLLASGAAGDEGLVPVFAGPFETIAPWRWDWFDAGD